MVHVTAATTTGQFRQNLLQGSSPSVATFRREAKAEQRPGRWGEERSEEGRHRAGVEREQQELQSVRADGCWQSLLTAAGAAGASLHGGLRNTQMTKISVPKRASSPCLHEAEPANPTSWSRMRHRPSSHCTTSLCRFPRATLFANFCFCQINLFPEA